MSVPSAMIDGNPVASGLAIGLATILAIAFVTHHPTAAGHDPAEILNDIAQKASADRLVHGALIGIMGAFLFGFSGFAAWLGLDGPLVRLGLIAYAAGCGSTVAAALIDGFIVPDIAALSVAPHHGDVNVAFDFLRIASSAIQYLTKLGLVLMSAGILSWSAALLPAADLRRWIGLLGLFAGGIPALLILAAGTVMNAHSLIAVLAAQGVWNLAVAVLLLNGPRRLGLR